MCRVHNMMNRTEYAECGVYRVHGLQNADSVETADSVECVDEHDTCCLNSTHISV